MLLDPYEIFHIIRDRIRAIRDREPRIVSTHNPMPNHWCKDLQRAYETADSAQKVFDEINASMPPGKAWQIELREPRELELMEVVEHFEENAGAGEPPPMPRLCALVDNSNGHYC